MALVKCKQCGNEVASNAAACPKCGAPPPRVASTGRKLALILGGLFGLCVIGNCVGAVSKRRGDSSSSPTQASTKSAEPVKMLHLRDLLAEYKDNEIRADSNFKGRIIQTAGYVRDVKRDILGKIFVTVGTGQQLEIPVVQCSFSEAHAQKAASLSQGTPVGIRGRVEGLMMNVVVKDCVFVDL
ncbi:hypothetical protein BO221_37130 [Archangium sp. Cb G35]|uniref:OB-fold protein n=1 Tax=Archangium sp. Cb G35 TaxID=1920190 RepID=UPI0009375DD5|nr:zinc-ribbon domain-containing protein [Archangium sp. Cb G35]OJT19127.1 hypothetical protein BO221_37130 [Archangium sp. Cb G35]